MNMPFAVLDYPTQEVVADTLSGPSVFDEVTSDFGELMDSVIPVETIAIGLLKGIALVVIAWLLIRLFDRAMKMWTKRFEDLPAIDPHRQRALTISTLLTSSVRYATWTVVLIMILGIMNIDVGALIATAGIAGIAIGFGAQSLVKDMIGGILLLFDDSIHVGDIVRIGTEEGMVEDIGVRIIKVRRFNGELLMVPAGDLRTFANRSMGFVRAIVVVGLSYDQDVDKIMTVMQKVADQFAAEHPDILLDEEPIVQAITEFADSSVNARIVIKMIPGEQWNSERELRRMLKQAFDREGIVIPFPQRTLRVIQEEATASTYRVAPPSPADTPGDQTASGVQEEPEEDESDDSTAY
ncbi:MAG: mechanosensitive ion channel family protein [Bacteroidetes bacterium]|nr:mechanosensitive ion channel family protein [Bacteroidota bacterium]MDA1333353.1 mechanosensitive ion channel family protein [Bacteroidota bacterium]